MIAQNKYFFITCTCELKEKFRGSKFMNKKINFFFFLGEKQVTLLCSSNRMVTRVQNRK